MYILVPDLSPEEIEEARASHKEFLEQSGAVDVEVSDFGRRELAYPIKPYTEGVYTLVTFQAAPADAHQIKEKFQALPNIIRHLLIKLDK
jgi:small subunit ribosomal protein S6